MSAQLQHATQNLRTVCMLVLLSCTCPGHAEGSPQMQTAHHGSRLRNSLIVELHKQFPRLSVEEMQGHATDQLLNIADAASAGIGRGGADWCARIAMHVSLPSCA